MNNFVNWLLNEMDKRGMSQADLARASGLSKTAISKIISESRAPGHEASSAIAKAFNFPPEIVFRKAGLLPEKGEEPPELKELTHLYLTASEEVQEDILEYARFKSRKTS